MQWASQNAINGAIDISPKCNSTRLKRWIEDVCFDWKISLCKHHRRTVKTTGLPPVVGGCCCMLGRFLGKGVGGEKGFSYISELLLK